MGDWSFHWEISTGILRREVGAELTLKATSGRAMVFAPVLLSGSVRL